MAKIKVTEKHIKDGVQASCYNCPVASALNELVDEYSEVNVGFGYASFLSVCYDDVEIELPYEVEEFIHRFDKGKKVQPFSFEMTIPEHCLKK